MEQDPESISLRPAMADDNARIVEIYNLSDHDSPSMTLERYEAEQAEAAKDHRGERFVATLGNRVVGVGSFHWAWWTGQSGIYAGNIVVDPNHLRQGNGTRLFELIHARLLLQEATRLVGWVREDAENGRSFATHLGFSETGQVIQEYRLHIPEADTSSYATLEARLAGDGLRIASLSELGKKDIAFLRELQRLWDDPGDEPAEPDQQIHSAFMAWQQQVLHAPGLSPDTHWIALEGERPVGVTFLKRLSAEAFENDYTGVAATHRGRGIATALKLGAIRWAQQNGAQWFLTSSEIGNKPMIAIHTRLGYRPGIQRVEVAYELQKIHQGLPEAIWQEYQDLTNYAP